MRLMNVYDAVDALAPFALSREYCDTYGAYDNSGIMLDCGEEVTGVLCSLDLSHAAVAEAKRTGSNVVFTHHPAIFRPVSALRAGEPLTECARAGISVLSAHLNLDCAQGGQLGGAPVLRLEPLGRGLHELVRLCEFFLFVAGGDFLLDPAHLRIDFLILQKFIQNRHNLTPYNRRSSVNVRTGVPFN